MIDSKKGWRLPTPKEWLDAYEFSDFRNIIQTKGYWTSEKKSYDSAKYFYGSRRAIFSGFVKLNQSVLCVHGKVTGSKKALGQGKSFDQEKMMREFKALLGNKSSFAHKTFIRNYKDIPEAQMQVDTVRTRLEMLSEDSSADYSIVVKESEDTLGCFLFGCEDPLKLPDFQSDFHIKN